MLHWLRKLRSRLVAMLAVALLAVTASSSAIAGPELGAAREGQPSVQAPNDAGNRAPAIAPHDAPIVAPGARETIPPLPAGYVTKDLGWLSLAYPSGAEARVAGIIADADAIKSDLVETLGQPVLGRLQVRVAQTVADMARLAPPDSPPPAYASGVAYQGLHFVLLSMLAPRGAEAVDLDEVFRHELAHVALEDAVQHRHVPAWFNEGLAIALSGEPIFTRTPVLWNATLSGTLLPLADLDRNMPSDSSKVGIGYAEAADFMRFLSGKSDRLRFTAMIGRVREGQAFERAVSEAYGADLRRLEFEWRGTLERRFSVIPVLTGGGLVWVLVMGGFIYAYVKKRRRAKAILARWEREEALEDARLAKLREAELDAQPALAPVTNLASISVKVEHQGRWHTLH